MCAVVVTSDASRWVLSTSFQTTPKPPAVPNEHENVINRGKKNVTYILFANRDIWRESGL